VSDTQLYLHDEIAGILRAARRPMQAAEIAAAVDSAGRYAKRDGSAMTANQIHARVSKHPELFERSPNGIHLRRGSI
jgi:hypothetical protein